MAKVFYREHGYVVSDKTVTTPKATHRLDDVKSVSVRYEVALIALLPALGIVAMVFAFWPYLYMSEIFWLVLGCSIVGVASVSVGTLQVNSLALAQAPEMGKTWGLVRRLKKVEAAISEAMSDDDDVEGQRR